MKLANSIETHTTAVRGLSPQAANSIAASALTRGAQHAGVTIDLYSSASLRALLAKDGGVA